MRSIRRQRGFLGAVLGGITGLLGGSSAASALIGGGLGLAGTLATNASQRGIASDTNLFNAAQAELARNFNAEQAALQRQWAENMSATQYRRAVNDLQKAGLNPMLAYSQGGANVGSGASASGPSAVGVMPNLHNLGSVMSSIDFSKYELNSARAARDRAETMENEKLRERLQKEIDLLGMRASGISARMNVDQQQTKLIREKVRSAAVDAEAKEAYFMKYSKAELDVALGEAERMKTEREIDESEYGRVLRYIERAIRALGAGVGAAVGGFLGGRLGRGLSGGRSGLGLRYPGIRR